MPDLSFKVIDLPTWVPDPKTEVPDLGSGGIRLNLTPGWNSLSDYYAPAPRVGALSDDERLTSVVCLSITYIGPKSRTERPRKTKIGTEVADVTCDSDTTFKVKRSKVNLQGPGHIVAASLTAFCINNTSVNLFKTHLSQLGSGNSHK